jgi:hypothetical protein
MFLLQGAVAALDEELVRSIAGEASSKGNAVWSTWHGMWCAQGAHFLGCMCLQVKADSSLRRDERFVHHAGPDPGSGLGLARCGAR